MMFAVNGPAPSQIKRAVGDGANDVGSVIVSHAGDLATGIRGGRSQVYARSRQVIGIIGRRCQRDGWRATETLPTIGDRIDRCELIVRTDAIVCRKIMHG